MVSGSADETFRATLLARTPDGALSTLIITRRGLGHHGRVWLTFDGAIKTTVVMTAPETCQLAELLGKAAAAR